jgi:hypothetical protein
VSLLRREQLSPEEREKKKELRAVRLERVNKARAATRGMQPPEPVRGLLVAGALAAAAVFSFLASDVQLATRTVNHKAVSKYVPVPPHPPQAIILLVLAVAAGVTIYWRRRLVTGVAFMLTAALGLDTPFPTGLTDLGYIVFGLPALYVLWMLIFRMNKEQKELLAKLTPATSGGGAARNTTKRAAGQASAATSRRGAKVQTTTVAGRPVPSSSGRYTPPRAKPKTAPRKS